MSAFQGGYSGAYHGFDLHSHGIGFAPALGIYFRLTKSLSVSWEVNKEYQWVTEQGTLTRSVPDNFHSRTTTPYNRTKYNSYWNFIKSISLNYGF
jgi:hypothetical protein